MCACLRVCVYVYVCVYLRAVSVWWASVSIESRTRLLVLPRLGAVNLTGIFDRARSIWLGYLTRRGQFDWDIWLGPRARLYCMPESCLFTRLKYSVEQKQRTMSDRGLQDGCQSITQSVNHSITQYLPTCIGQRAPWEVSPVLDQISRTVVNRVCQSVSTYLYRTARPLGSSPCPPPGISYSG